MKRKILALFAVAAATLGLTLAGSAGVATASNDMHFYQVPGCYWFHFETFTCYGVHKGDGPGKQSDGSWGGFGQQTTCNLDSLQPTEVRLGVTSVTQRFYVSGCSPNDRWKVYFGETGYHASIAHPEVTFRADHMPTSFAGPQDLLWANHIIGHNMDGGGDFGIPPIQFVRNVKFGADVSVRPGHHSNAGTVRVEADLYAAHWGNNPHYKGYSNHFAWLYSKNTHPSSTWSLVAMLFCDSHGHISQRVYMAGHGSKLVKLTFEGDMGDGTSSARSDTSRVVMP